MPYKFKVSRNLKLRANRAAAKSAASSISTEQYDNKSVISDISHSSSRSSREEILEDKVKKLEEELAHERQHKEQLREQMTQQMTQQMAETQRALLATMETMAANIGSGGGRGGRAPAAPKERVKSKEEKFQDKLDELAANSMPFNEFLEKYIIVENTDTNNSYHTIIKKAVKKCKDDGYALPIQCKNQKPRNYYVLNDERKWDEYKGRSVDIFNKLNDNIGHKLMIIGDAKVAEFYEKYGIRDENGKLIRGLGDLLLKPEYQSVTEEMAKEMEDLFLTNNHEYRKKYCVRSGYSIAEQRHINGYKNDGPPELNYALYGDKIGDQLTDMLNSYTTRKRNEDGLVEFANKLLPLFAMD